VLYIKYPHEELFGVVAAQVHGRNETGAFKKLRCASISPGESVMRSNHLGGYRKTSIRGKMQSRLLILRKIPPHKGGVASALFPPCDYLLGGSIHRPSAAKRLDRVRPNIWWI
jgi:hypothetical protein